MKTADTTSARDSQGRTRLHLAAIRGDDDRMQELVEAGADVSALDNRGNTPLHYCGHLETTKCLVNCNADLFVRNQHGDRPLDLMRRKGVDPAVVLLTEHLMSSKTFNDDPHRPLIGVTSSLVSDGNPRQILYEFCTDVGPRRLAVIILVVLCLSLYTAYVVTGVGLVTETQILVDDSYNGELDGSFRRMEL